MKLVKQGLYLNTIIQHLLIYLNNIKMKHLFLVGLLFVVSVNIVSAQKKSDSYTFNTFIVWSNEYVFAEEEDNGESDDNFTQYFSEKGDYVGNSVFGGGVFIRDYANDSEVMLIEGQGSITKLETSSTITFKLSDTGDEEEILGYNAKKYTWKDSNGRTGEIWFATDLDFPSAKKGVNYPFSTLLPNPPSNLGIVLKANGRLKNGDSFDMEADQIQTEPLTFNTADYSFKN